MLDHEKNLSAPISNTRPSSPWRPIFIVGTPRSGTKLLRGLLNQNPSIRIPDVETDFFPHIVRWVQAHGEPRTEIELERLLAVLRGTPYFAHRRAKRELSAETWRAWCERFDASGLFEGFVRCETDTNRSSAVRWGDKSPAYVRHVDLLLEHFPTAQIVHIVRDVRDCCLSVRKAWGKDIRRAAYRWNVDVAGALRASEKAPSRCLLVRYEDLLRSPTDEMKRVCSFLGVSFSESMVVLRQPAERRGDGAGHAGVLRNNYHKFEGQLTRVEIADIESLAFDTMHLLGMQPLYARRQRRMSPVEAQWRRGQDALQVIRQDRARFGLVRAISMHFNHYRATQ